MSRNDYTTSQNNLFRGRFIFFILIIFTLVVYPIYFLAAQSTVDITITNNGVGGPWLRVDGILYVEYLKTFNWVIGSNHSISVISEFPIPLLQNWEKLVFTTWSNGVENPTLSYTVPNHDETLTANYKMRFHVEAWVCSYSRGVVTINSNPNIFEYWFDEGEIVRLEAIPDNGYIFKEWEIYTIRYYTLCGTTTDNPLYVDNPTNICARFTVGSSIEETSGLPTKFALYPNYPNPFNPTTTITYSISKPGQVSLKIYNTLGQEIICLIDDYQLSDKYQITFDASHLPSGAYIYVLESGGKILKQKMLLLK